MSVDDDRPQPRPGVLSIEAYVPGKSTAPGAIRVFKLSANETPLGPSPRAIAAFRSAADHLHDYPEGTARKLREAIGKSFGLDPARIVCGAGSDDLLNLLTQSYVGPGDEDVIRKLLGDLTSAGVECDESRIRTALDHKTAEARRQLIESLG